MKCLLYILSSLVILTMTSNLGACQDAKHRWEDRLYDQLDRREVKAQRHAQYAAEHLLAKQEPLVTHNSKKNKQNHIPKNDGK